MLDHNESSYLTARQLRAIKDLSLNLWPIFPDLDTLQQKLSIPPVNTGRQRFLTGPSGIVTDDMEALHARRNESGMLHLVSGVEFQIFAYRGQVKEISPCVPTLGRNKDKTLEQRLLSLCRCVAFEEALEIHPLVKKARQLEIYVDCKGLSQHYGQSTDMLDVTGSFAVASFFATCHCENGCWFPVSDDNAPLGVIYRVNACILQDRQPDLFHLVGWQPLPRPEQQRAFTIRMEPGQDFLSSKDFTTERAYFKQNAAISHRIWKEFDEGRALFPNDPAEQLSKQAQTICEFTETQMTNAWSRVEAWECRKFTPEQRSSIEVSTGITIISSTALTWNHLNVESRDEQLTHKIQDVLNRVRYRRSAYSLK